MQNAIERILAAGVLAPSGDNCQPWRFEVAENVIRVFLIPERDRSLYSWGNRASYIAHGALLENMRIAAEPLGYQLTIQDFPDPQNPLLTARITLEEAPIVANPLADAIPLGCSNRKKYQATPLSNTQRQQLREAGGADTMWIEESTTRKKIASALAYNEKVLFENQSMHKFFFDHMLWTTQDATKNLLGFPIGALELPPPIRALWPAFRHWSVISALTSLGFENGIVFGNTPIYASGAVLACLTLEDRSAQEFLRVGHIAERIWLTATHLGLSVQILTGIPLLMNRVVANEPGLSPAHSNIVTKQYGRLQEATGSTRIIALLLRIGVSNPPSARTPRMAPLIA